jgi:hypothetical protein
MRAGIQTGVALLFAAVLAVLYFAAPDVVDTLTVEDGAFENLTALFYLLAAIAFVFAIRRKSAGSAWLALLALACVFVAGEEISWGQRIFGWATPEVIADVNVQEETTIHNLEGVHGNIRALAVVFVAAFCVVLPVTDHYSSALRSFYRRLRLPVFPWSGIAWVAVAIGFMLVPRLVGDHVGALDEVGETALAVAFLVFGLRYGSGRTNLTLAESVEGSRTMGFERAS